VKEGESGDSNAASAKGKKGGGCRRLRLANRKENEENKLQKNFQKHFANPGVLITFALAKTVKLSVHLKVKTKVRSIAVEG
jgi:hypothetical protein